MAPVNRDAPLELRLDRAAIHGVAQQRELRAVGRRGQRAAHVVHVKRIAADVIRRRVQRQVRRPSEIPEEGVADIHVGHVVGERVSPRARRVLRPHDDVPRQVADVRQKVQHAVEVARNRDVQAGDLPSLGIEEIDVGLTDCDADQIGARPPSIAVATGGKSTRPGRRRSTPPIHRARRRPGSSKCNRCPDRTPTSSAPHTLPRQTRAPRRAPIPFVRQSRAQRWPRRC